MRRFNRSMGLTTGLVSGLIATALLVATPASAGLFGGNKPKTPSAASTPTISTVAPTPGDDFHKATKSEIETALRSDPLAQAAFFSKQFEHDATNAQMGLYLSNALRALGRYDQAADIAHRVLLFAPDNTAVLLAAARAHIAGNDAFLAVDPLKHAIELKPKDWTAYSLLGVAYQQIKRPDDAQAQWAMALQLSPNNPDVLTNIAMTKVVQGDLSGAESLLRTAVAQAGAGMQVRQNLALVLGLQGKLGEAEKLLREDLPPQQADADLAWLQQAASHGQTQTNATASTAGAAPTRSWASVQAAGG